MAKKSQKADKAFHAPPVGLVKQLGGGHYEMSADKLYIGKMNMRHSHVFDPHLLASIKAHGQLNELIVKSNGADNFEVVDGGRRFVTILEGIRTEVLPPEFPIKVRLDESAGKELSVAANLHLAAHPLDVCDAIHELAKSEEDEIRIAEHFGQSVVWVQQRAQLAQLTDKAKEAFRAGRFDLKVAGMMTRLTAKQQDAICKGKDRIYDNEVVADIRDRGIDCSEALFDWQKLYPPSKVERSLFDDMVLLTDRNLFKQLQEDAVAEKIAKLEAEGYNVVKLKREDYATNGKYVVYTGKLTPEIKKSLTVLIQPQHDGIRWQISRPSLDRKTAVKVEKGAKGKPDKTTEAPVPMNAKQLSSSQIEILQGHLYASARQEIADGDASEAFEQWIVIEKLSTIAEVHNGPTRRWESLQKDYPLEFERVKLVDTDTKAGRVPFEAFRKLTKDQRIKLYRRAVAGSLFVPHEVGPKALAKTVETVGLFRVEPGEAFFKRYRSDQLIDYLKRSGVTKESGGMPIDSKKATAVKVACEVARGKGAWQFGQGGK